MPIKGLTYIENAVPKKEVNNITQWFFSDVTQQKLVPITNSPSSRRVLHYGFKYNYQNGTIHDITSEMPDIIKGLLKYVPIDNPEEYFNQCIVNQYKPGQGISSHIDRKAYGDRIACFTFGLSGREMQFSRAGYPKVKLYTLPGSLYIMEDEARYKWKHSMVARYSDKLENQVKIVRKACFSVTFRNVPDKPVVNVVT